MGTTDTILRFGGLSSAEMQWPEQQMASLEDEPQFEKIEKQVRRLMQKLSKHKEVGGSRHRHSTGGLNGGSMLLDDSGSQSSGEMESMGGGHDERPMGRMSTH